MSLNFSANQFDKRFDAQKLNNWEYAKYYPKYPRTRKGATKIIGCACGHLLSSVPRTGHPFGNYLSTYQLPDKITRKFCEEYNECLIRRDRFKHFPQPKYHPCEIALGKNVIPTPVCPSTCKTARRALAHCKEMRLINHPCEREQIDERKKLQKLMKEKSQLGDETKAPVA